MAVKGMNPSVRRAAVLATELVVFFLVTAFTSYFLSHAAAWRHEQDDKPPARFPVIAFEGDRERPQAQNYFVVPWSEWQAAVEKRPAATLLLPERSATIPMGDAGEASFTAADVPGSGQAPTTGPAQVVELKWRTGGGEQHATYLAQAGSIEPRYLRTLGTDTFLTGAAVGFLTGLFTGRALRRRWLAR
ncbi:MAG TPA: hypothetical protein VIA19_07535 [Burkholderiales bacterium]